MGDAGGALSKWQMFVWILNCFMVHSLDSVHTKSIKLSRDQSECDVLCGGGVKFIDWLKSDFFTPVPCTIPKWPIGYIWDSQEKVTIPTLWYILWHENLALVIVASELVHQIISFLNF